MDRISEPSGGTSGRKTPDIVRRHAELGDQQGSAQQLSREEEKTLWKEFIAVPYINFDSGKRSRPETPSDQHSVSPSNGEGSEGARPFKRSRLEQAQTTPATQDNMPSPSRRKDKEKAQVTGSIEQVISFLSHEEKEFIEGTMRALDNKNLKEQFQLVRANESKSKKYTTEITNNAKLLFPHFDTFLKQHSLFTKEDANYNDKAAFDAYNELKNIHPTLGKTAKAWLRWAGFDFAQN